MRPIDADRLLKTIANLDVECVDQKQASIMLNTIQKVFPQIVNNEPTIEAQPVNGWISVEEKLPENETEVLIYCPEFVCTIRLAMWIEDGFYVDKEDLIVKAAPNGYCTHWMPLPEPPKEE